MHHLTEKNDKVVFTVRLANVCVQGGVLNDSLLYLAGADYHHHCFFEWTQTLMLHLTGIPLWLKTEAQYIGLTVKKTEGKY